ncbi:MAG TPA: IS5/IS1182 family transposase, partial [Paenirhodobacter sp.]
TTWHKGYALFLRHRKPIEEAFGWAKTIGGAAQTAFRGIERARASFIMTLAAGHRARLPKLLAA